MTDRLHPESMNQLRQLAKLHGIKKIQHALDKIARDQEREWLLARGKPELPK